MDLSMLTQTPATGTANKAVPEAYKKAAKEFEQYYIQQFLDLSAAKVDTDQMFYGGYAEELFQQQMHEETAKAVSRRGGFGIADAMIRQMEVYQNAEQVPLPAQAAAAYQASAQASTQANVQAGVQQ